MVATVVFPLYESFDAYIAGAVPPWSYIWTGMNDGSNVLAATGRRGGYCLRTIGQTGLWATGSTNEARWVGGIALRYSVLPTPYPGDLYPNVMEVEDTPGGFLDMSKVQVSVQVTSTGAVRLSRGNQVATLAQSVAGLFTVGTYAYLELVVNIGNSGSAEVWVNGQQVITFTGDTQQTANAYANTFRMGNHNGGNVPGYVEWDDIHVNCGTTAARRGDIPIDRVFLDGAGAVTGWTPDSGSNWARVNEQGDDGDTSYVSDTTPATQVDSYTHATASGSPIFGVQVRVVGRTTSGTDTVAPFVRIDGVNYLGTAGTLTTSYGCVRHVWELNPATGLAWTLAEVNAAEVGVAG